MSAHLQIKCDRFHCYITPLNDDGKVLLRHLTGNTKHVINAEHKEDFIKELEDREISYEEH